VCASSAAAQPPIAAGTSCSGQPTIFNQTSIFANKNTSAALFCEGPATQNVWVSIVNTGPVMVPFACPSTTSAFNCSYTSGLGNNLSSTISTGLSVVFEVPAGDYLSLNPSPQQSGFNDNADYGASIVNVTPVSGGPALATGQQCSGANFIPASVNCLWSGQFGAVTQNSWATFDNTGTTQAKIKYYGLSGSSDSLTLAPGQLGYIGVGAGHASSSSELQLQQSEASKGNCITVNCVPPTPASSPSLLRVSSVVPQSFAGFTLENTGQCQTTNFNVNPVDCAESGQMGVLDEQASLELDNSSNFVNSVKITGSAGGGTVTVAPGEYSVVTLNSGSHVITQCITPTGSSCPTGAPAAVTVNGVEGAPSAATLATPSVAGGGRRLSAPLRCASSHRRRCQGTITLSFPGRGRGTGATVSKASFNLASSGKQTFQLLAGRLRGRLAKLTVRTREPNGKSVITGQRVVKLKR
jgi:hypothetical protein